MAPASSLTLSLDQLADGGGDPVLVVDFVQFSTTQQLSDDLGRHGGGHPVYRIDPVTDLAREPGYRVSGPQGRIAVRVSGTIRGRGKGAT